MIIGTLNAEPALKQLLSENDRTKAKADQEECIHRGTSNSYLLILQAIDQNVDLVDLLMIMILLEQKLYQ